jgi:hypothetical protein
MPDNVNGWSFVLAQYGYGDLCDRLNMLAILYHDSGDLNKAVRILKEAKQLCQDHGIRFDSEDLLREYSEEQLED